MMRCLRLKFKFKVFCAFIFTVSFFYVVFLSQLSGWDDKFGDDQYLSSDISVYKKRWEEFVQNEQAEDSATKNAPSSMKFAIMHDAPVGYGNRMYTFMNTVAISVLTGCKIIVNWQHIDKYISLNSKKFIFNIPVESFINMRAAKVYKFPFEVHNSFRTDKNASTLYQNMPLDYDLYRVVGYGPVFFELLTNPSHYDKLVKGGFVSKQTIENARLAIANEKNNSVKIEKLYQIGFEFGAFVLRNVWVPNSELQTKINDFVRQNFNGHYVIGIQVRFEYMFGYVDVDRLMKCASRLEARYSAKQFTGKKVKWFLSADSEAESEVIKSKYADKLIAASGRIAHVMYGDGYERAIIDNELLSKCDDLIITGGSSFGFISAMRTGRMPLFFNGRRNSKSCERMSFNNYPTRPEGFAVI